MVEFAVVFALLLLPIIFGILYFGRYESYSNQETQMAESAARYASVNGNPGAGSLQNYIKAQAPSELLTASANVTSPLTVAIYCSASPCTQTATFTTIVTACVTATVSYPGLLGGTSTMLQKATMPLEQAQTAWTPDSGTPC
jgi:Flp pilus assembly protein TadG